jgi:catechol 2,3-dioxygenase-like lactoylglutathione lyase family enzyme
MQLAKPQFDIGLATNNLEAMLRFWQGEAGAAFDHILPIRPRMAQHRHDLMGSVLKINQHDAPLPANPPSGYIELLIAREGLSAPRAMTDPDGNRVSLVPPGTHGVRQIGVRLTVRDLAAQRGFYTEALGLSEEAPALFRAGEGAILVDEAADAPAEAPFDGPGWRYITFQIRKVDAEHAHALAHGGREAMAPTTLGTIARISMVKDPAGNWIELSQRANLTGTLEPG